MRLYHIGELGWKESQLIYHSMAHLGMEGVVICRPREPYFCVGFHQDLSQELDTARLDAEGVPYFRRETGGGTVRLDRDQVFYQVLVRRDDPQAPLAPDRFFERYLGPVVDALATLGMKGTIVPPNDILVGGRKISGNGGGDVAGCKVLVGDILHGFDPAPMVEGLRCPTEELRDAALASMRRNIVTVGEAAPGVTIDALEAALVRSFLSICKDGEGALPDQVLAKVGELEARMLSSDWLFFPGPRRPWRRVKVREGVHVAAVEVGGSAPGTAGHGHLVFEVSDGRLASRRLVPGQGATEAALGAAVSDLIGRGDGPLATTLQRALKEMGVPGASWAGMIEALRG